MLCITLHISRKFESNINRDFIHLRSFYLQNVFFITNWYFLLYLRSSCDLSPKDRGDGYRVYMSANELIKNTSKTVSEQKSIYSNKYASSKKQSKSIELWDTDKRGKYRFLTRAEYLNTTHPDICSPILRIQFMASKDQENQNCFNSSK